jgi:hypothetical protein
LCGIQIPQRNLCGITLGYTICLPANLVPAGRALDIFISLTSAGGYKKELSSLGLDPMIRRRLLKLYSDGFFNFPNAGKAHIRTHLVT